MMITWKITSHLGGIKKIIGHFGQNLLFSFSVICDGSFPVVAVLSRRSQAKSSLGSTAGNRERPV